MRHTDTNSSPTRTRGNRKRCSRAVHISTFIRATLTSSTRIKGGQKRGHWRRVACPADMKGRWILKKSPRNYHEFWFTSRVGWLLSFIFLVSRNWTSQSLHWCLLVLGRYYVEHQMRILRTRRVIWFLELEVAIRNWTDWINPILLKVVVCFALFRLVWLANINLHFLSFL